MLKRARSPGCCHHCAARAGWLPRRGQVAPTCRSCPAVPDPERSLRPVHFRRSALGAVCQGSERCRDLDAEARPAPIAQGSRPAHVRSRSTGRSDRGSRPDFHQSSAGYCGESRSRQADRLAQLAFDFTTPERIFILNRHHRAHGVSSSNLIRRNVAQSEITHFSG
jgi:hypothetical protein